MIALLSNDEFASAWEGRQDPRAVCRQFAMRSRQEAVNGNSASLQTKEREAVVIPLPISMHTGQIILLAKMYAEIDPEFYDFSDSTPVLNWKREP